MEIVDIVKVIVPTTLSFFVGIAITPAITNYLYKHEMWKKKIKTVAVDGHGTPIFNQLHAHKEIGTPRLGGVVIWLSVFIVGACMWTISRFTDAGLFDKIEFVSRNQTWIPFWALLIGAGVGLIDDLLEIKGAGSRLAGGLSLKLRLAIIAFIGLTVGLWFFTKLGVTAIGLPFIGSLEVGILLVPIYMLIMIAVYSGGVIDGLDGLSGGVFASIFAAYGIYAFSLGQFDLAAFCGLLIGGILAFLWYNIPPARFYMSETGSMALTITVSIMAFMTDDLAGGMGIGILPIVGALLLGTAGSSLLQVLSKKFRGGKKIFLVAPIHHHFEAIGWPAYKVVMRYWIVSVVLAAMGLLVAFVG
jgi:phospho-N-acetylmuramoyl-pentapeptide-transferase